MFRKITPLILVALCWSVVGYSQNFSKTMTQQKAAIKTAYKKKRLTHKEYNKLMDEQQVIYNTIEKYKDDGYLSSEEKNKIASKQQRAANRIRKYQVNNERY
jgi:ATP-dependent protease HslVU (ClpYQ) ATPase subunit